MKKNRKTVIAILIALLGCIVVACTALGIYDCANNSSNNNSSSSEREWTDNY